MLDEGALSTVVNNDIFKEDEGWLSNGDVVVAIVTYDEELDGKALRIFHAIEAVVAGVRGGRVEGAG